MGWKWHYQDESGDDVGAPDSENFESRSDAESWLGENFGDLADAGVAAVVLFEGDRKIYGPMSLSS